MTDINEIFQEMKKIEMERNLRFVRLVLDSQRTRYGIFRESDEDCAYPIEGKTYESATEATVEAIKMEILLDLNEKLQIKPVSGGK